MADSKCAGRVEGGGGHDNLSFSVPWSAVTSRRSRSLIPLSDDVRVDDLERRV